MGRKLLLQNIWHWLYRGWNIYQFLVWLGGTGVITFVVHSFSHAVRSSPLVWQVVLYVAIGALLLIIVRITWHYLWLQFKGTENQKLTISNDRKSDSARPNIGIIDNIFGADAHKCTQCGWSFRVTALDKLAYCPKCGNVDKI